VGRASRLSGKASRWLDPHRPLDHGTGQARCLSHCTSLGARRSGGGNARNRKWTGGVAHPATAGRCFNPNSEIEMPVRRRGSGVAAGIPACRRAGLPSPAEKTARKTKGVGT